MTHSSKTTLGKYLLFGCFFLLVWVFTLTLYGFSSAKAETNAGCIAGPLNGTLNASASLCTAFSPYLVNNDWTIAQGIVLTIDPGVIVRIKTPVQGDGKITVRGTLRANGTAADPITFRSGWTNPQPRDWEYIHFTSTSVNNRLNYATIIHAGAGGAEGAIKVQSSSVVITRNTITNNYEYGIRILDDSQPVINNNNLAGNGQNPNGTWVAIQNQDGDPVEATCNWWGSASGPEHDQYNPHGTGDPVDDDVLFYPWLIAPYPGGACTGRPGGIALPAVLR